MKRWRCVEKTFLKQNKLATSVVNKIANQATEFIKSKHRQSEEIVTMIEEMFKLNE